MNTLKLRMRVRHSEGALVRVLSVTRRRRFDLVHVSADTTLDGAFLDVQMTVQAERAGNTLLSQLAKLEDVSDVELLAPNEAEGEAQVAKLGA